MRSFLCSGSSWPDTRVSFVVLGVDAKDIESDAKAFAKEKKATWPIVVDSSNDVAQAYGVGAVPQTFFIKPNGKVALRYYAQIPDDQWSDALAKITARSAHRRC